MYINCGRGWGYALGLLKSEKATRIIIPPNRNVTINGYMDKKNPMIQFTVMVHQSAKTCMQDDVDIETPLHPYVNEDYQIYLVALKSGYHQIEESHKEMTVFTVGPLVFYEFNKMSFGLSNTPAMYQPLQEQCFGDIHIKICFIF